MGPDADARRRPALAGLILCVPLLACGPSPAPTEHPEATLPAEPEAPGIPAEASNKSAGEQLDLTIPLFEGGSMELSQLRGRAVVLELSASWEAGWSSMHARYPEMLKERGDEQLAIVLVSLDPESAVIGQDVAAMGEDGAAIIRGWDPMGAIAAKLKVARFPTVFVLDAEGRIVEVHNEYDEAMFDRVQATLGASAGAAAQ
jgi:hypothetical protein